MTMSGGDEKIVSFAQRYDVNHDINEMKNFVEADKPNESRFCPHTSILVDEFNRSIRCRLCGQAMDSFDYLLSLAKKETKLDWELRRLRSEIKKSRENLQNLQREEVNTRARVKTAQFRLNDVNLALHEAGETLIKIKGYHGSRKSVNGKGG